MPNARDKWKHWNVHQLAVCGHAAAHGTTECGTHLTPVQRDNPYGHLSELAGSRADEVKQLINYGGGGKRVILGGDLNVAPPDGPAADGATKHPLVPLYGAYTECDQPGHGGRRAGTGTFQRNGKRKSKLHYLFTDHDAQLSCYVYKGHIKRADHVPFTATMTYPA